MFIAAKDDGGDGDNWTTGAISRAKLHSNHHHQQTNFQFFYRPDALPVVLSSMDYINTTQVIAIGHIYCNVVIPITDWLCAHF